MYDLTVRFYRGTAEAEGAENWAFVGRRGLGGLPPTPNSDPIPFEASWSCIASGEQRCNVGRRARSGAGRIWRDLAAPRGSAHAAGRGAYLGAVGYDCMHFVAGNIYSSMQFERRRPASSGRSGLEEPPHHHTISALRLAAVLHPETRPK